MYYEVYVDVLFVENLWMNILLLWLTARADRVSVKKWRIIMAAGAGSLGACLLTIFSAGLSGAGCFLGSILLAAGMVRIAFSRDRGFLARLVLLYITGFILNGILRYLEQFHYMAGIWLAVSSSLSVCLLSAAEYALRCRRKNLGLIVQTELKLGVGKIKTEALFDTGNSLYDPVSGKPVCILARDLLEQLLKESAREIIPRAVPYHTISQNGILEAYILDELILYLPDGKKILERPVVAFMPGKESQYKLILHRDMLPS